uniref:Uncharacterized protein n=1 Tax=Myoviridae sp. ctOAa14 TaxID=2826646 RepID=A0A8S5MRG2_9CAUD|nr:MAG TPA: hypothetical protein [Myoviridae sp. ctOAa14]
MVGAVNREQCFILAVRLLRRGACPVTALLYPAQHTQSCLPLSAQYGEQATEVQLSMSLTLQAA